jgi:hypothetical protein
MSEFVELTPAEVTFLSACVAMSVVHVGLPGPVTIEGVDRPVVHAGMRLALEKSLIKLGIDGERELILKLTRLLERTEHE